MILSIDHVVLLVENLESATLDYAELGFTVVPGGEHTNGLTHNALIAFADETYMELIAYRQPLGLLPPAETLPGHAGLWLRRASTGEGFLDFALLPEAITDDIAAAAARGLPLEGPAPGGRQRPDGQTVAWQTAQPATGDLPFLCADVTPRALRVPGGAARTHANGARGIANLIVAVQDLEASAARYQALLGTAPQPAGAGRVLLPLGGATITLAGPAAGTDVRDYLDGHGERPYALQLAAAEPATLGPLDATRAHGARLEFVQP